jgi:hypothetical protein
MRTISVLALVAWAVGVPGALRAADLTFAISGQTEYDSNVFRSSEDEEDDVLFRLRPWVRVHDDRGQDLTYSLRYMVPVEFAVSNTEVDDVDQHVSGEATYQFNDRFQVYATNTFRYLRSELFTNLEGTGPGGDASLVNQERDRITLNDAALGSSYSFTPRLVGSARLDHSFYDPSRDDRQETSALSGTGDLLYLVTPKHRLGGGVMIAHQNFDETDEIVGSTTNVYQVFGSWIWTIDEKSELALTAGPSLLVTDQDDADATVVRGLVPFSQIDGSFTAPNGFVDRDGVDVSGDSYANGVVLLGRLAHCDTAAGIPVLTSGVSCPQTVVLDATPGADTGLIDEIRNSTATVQNLDPDGDDSTDVTVFASATVTRHWTPNLHTALRYTRRQDTASGLGGSVVNDSVSLSNTWSMTDKWQFAVRGDWSLRNSITDASRVLVVATGLDSPLGAEAFLPNLIAGLADTDGGLGTSVTVQNEASSIDTMRYGIAGRATHFFARNTSGYVQLTYNRQTSQSDTLGDPSDFDDFLATIGIQHVFEPIKLW